MEYADRIALAIRRLTRNINLPKSESKNILENECPFCEYCIDCSLITKESAARTAKLCKKRSSDIDRVWVLTTEDRPQVHIGDKFSKLTVIESVGKRDRSDAHRSRADLLWRCKCECGNEIVVRGDNLISNHTKSCGCLRRSRKDKGLVDLISTEEFGVRSESTS